MGDQKCESKEDYVYTDCVATEFLAFYNQMKEDCTLPWTISLITTATNTTEKENPCKDENIANSKTLLIQDFFMRARGYGLENCKEPCTATSYDVGTVTYDRYSQMGQNILQTWFDISNITQKATEGSSNLFINYQSMEMKVSQKVRILNEASFISSVGGNLGLFIGFSFLDSLF